MKCSKKIIGVLVLIILFFSNNVLANEIESEKYIVEEYSEKYQEWLNLPEEERKNTIPPLPFNVEYKEEKLNVAKSFFKSTFASLESVYNLRMDIDIEIKDQMSTGLCWGFSANSVLETHLAKVKGQNYQFSERHIEYDTARDSFIDGENENALDRYLDGGGHQMQAFAYYARGSGPVLEQDMPFENNADPIVKSSIPTNATVKKVDNMVYFPNIYKYKESGKIVYKDGNNNVITDENVEKIRTNIKNHIKNYGAITASIYSTNDEKYFNETKRAAYLPDTTKRADHAVTIIGWDDSYNKNNFNDTPVNNGAYLVLNSWGEDWGEGSGYAGVYYISYDDYLVESLLRGVTSVSDVNYDNIYQHDTTSMMTCMSNAKCSANVFECLQNEKLTEIMVGSILEGKYNVYVNVNNDKSKVLDLSTATKVASNVLLKYGYTTIDITDINLTKGNKFAIIVEDADETDGIATVALEMDLVSSSIGIVKSQAGESFLYDGYAWCDLEDITSLEGVNKNLCIKGFTQVTTPKFEASNISGSGKEGQVGEFNFNVKSSYQDKGKTVSVTFKDSSGKTVNGITVKSNTIKGNGAFIKFETPITLTKGTYYADIKLSSYSTVTKSFSIGESAVSRIEMVSPPTKDEYIVGEELDLSGGKIKVIYNDGTSPETLDITSEMIVDGTLNTSGEKTITVKFGGKTATFTVTVTDNITGITIATLPKTTYNVGDELDISGGQIKVTYQSGKTETLGMTTSMIDGIENPLTEGTKTITVNYSGFKTTFTITVINSVTAIAIETSPKTAYIIGDRINLERATIRVTYKDLTSKVIAINRDMLSIDSDILNFTGTKTITVSYGGQTTEFTVTVTNDITGIAIKTKPTKTTYIFEKDEDKLDLTGGQITVIYQNQQYNKTVSMTAAEVRVEGFSNKTLGTNTVKVIYTYDSKEFETTLDLTITNNVTKIAIATLPNKTLYKLGEELDLTGATLSVEYENEKYNTIKPISKQTMLVTGYEPEKVETQSVTVAYKEGEQDYRRTFFKVQVITGIGIDIEKTKTKYLRGEQFEEPSYNADFEGNNIANKHIVTYNRI